MKKEEKFKFRIPGILEGAYENPSYKTVLIVIIIAIIIGTILR